MLPLSHPKSALHVSGNLQMVSHPVAPRSVFLCPGHMLPWPHGSQGSPLTVGCGCWEGRPFLCHWSHGEMTGTKGTPFCQLVTLSTPFYGRQAEWILVHPGSLSQTQSLDTFSETGTFSHGKRPSPSTNWGTPKTGL